MESDQLPLLDALESVKDSEEGREEIHLNDNGTCSNNSLVDTSESRRRRHHFFSSDLIVATFVVAFDTKKGNVAL